MYKDKITQSVAEAVKKVMDEDLKGKQHKIDANKNEKIDAHDFKLLRSRKKVTEESTQIDEGKADDAAEILAKKREERKEKMEFKKSDFPEKKSIVRNVVGSYGKEEEKDDEDKPAEKKKRGRPKGSTNKRRFNTNLYKESFSTALDVYSQSGLKGLYEQLSVEEEVVQEESDNEQYTKELEAAKAKDRGEGKKAEVAKPAVQAVKNEEIEFLDANNVNGVAFQNVNEEVEQIDERTLTSSETKKKEEVVKSMKKKLSGFRERYGKRAKEVMYATATKVAKGE
jgi:hypothetical protein